MLARLERLPLGERGLGGLTLAFEPEREDFDAPEEAGESLDEPRHARIKEPTRAQIKGRAESGSFAAADPRP